MNRVDLLKCVTAHNRRGELSRSKRGHTCRTYVVVGIREYNNRTADTSPGATP